MSLPSSLHQALGPDGQRLMKAFRFVLVSPSHAGNIGSAVRAMKTMGLDDLAVVNPRTANYLNHREARALASGATDLLARAWQAASLREAVADCQWVVAVSASPREFGPAPCTPGEIAGDALAQLDAGRVRKVAIVFGTERTGLSIQEMGLCQALLSIPADPRYSSLNLAQAAQVVAFSLRQQVMLRKRDMLRQANGRQQDAPRIVGFPEQVEPYADHAAIERLHMHLEQALVAIGYLDPAEPKRLMARLRRLLSRTRLEAPEVDLLRGVCKQMEKVAAKSLNDPLP